MLSIEGFQVAFKYFQLFEQGLVCTVTLSFLTVVRICAGTDSGIDALVRHRTS